MPEASQRVEPGAGQTGGASLAFGTGGREGSSTAGSQAQQVAANQRRRKCVPAEFGVRRRCRASVSREHDTPLPIGTHQFIFRRGRLPGWPQTGPGHPEARPATWSSGSRRRRLGADPARVPYFREPGFLLGCCRDAVGARLSRIPVTWATSELQEVKGGRHFPDRRLRIINPGVSRVLFVKLVERPAATRQGSHRKRNIE